MFKTSEAAQKQLETFSENIRTEALEHSKTVTLERLVEDLMLEG